LPQRSGRYYKANFRTRRVEQFVKESWDPVIQAVSRQLDKEMESEQWDWPRETVRSDGRVVFSPRDIIDRGDLKESKEVRRVQGTQAEISYSARYAAIVHEGATLSNGTRLLARPWINRALENYSIPKNFAEQFKRRLQGL